MQNYMLLKLLQKFNDYKAAHCSTKMVFNVTTCCEK